MVNFSITQKTLFYFIFRALCSETSKKHPFFKTYFGFSILDIYKCPIFNSLFTFGKIFVTETYSDKYVTKFVTIYALNILFSLFHLAKKYYLSIITDFVMFFMIFSTLLHCSSFDPPDMEFITIFKY